MSRARKAVSRLAVRRFRRKPRCAGESPAPRASSGSLRTTLACPKGVFGDCDPERVALKSLLEFLYAEFLYAEPDSGNPTVRDRRGLAETWAMVERGIHLAYRKSECWKLSAYGRARRISTRQFKMCGCPMKMSKSIPEYIAVPLLGQHNEQVHAEWMGYSKEEVAKLKEEGVI